MYNRVIAHLTLKSQNAVLGQRSRNSKVPILPITMLCSLRRMIRITPNQMLDWLRKQRGLWPAGWMRRAKTFLATRRYWVHTVVWVVMLWLMFEIKAYAWRSAAKWPKLRPEVRLDFSTRPCSFHKSFYGSVRSSYAGFCKGTWINGHRSSSYVERRA